MATEVRHEPVRRAATNPFVDHPLRRYAWAWDRLCDRTGRHLDAGCEAGPFLGPLASTTDLICTGADPSPEYLTRLSEHRPTLRSALVGIDAQWPFRTGAFSSATALDVMEHVPHEEVFLAELHRVLEVGGLLLLSVPARHLFSVLDPDNAKFRFPGVHRFVWSLRYGRDRYDARFVRTGDNLIGDMSVGRDEHTNYSAEGLVTILERAGFQISDVEGANLFWRWFQVPSLLTSGRARKAFDRAALADGLRFGGGPGSGVHRRANLFVTARRS